MRYGFDLFLDSCGFLWAKNQAGVISTILYQNFSLFYLFFTYQRMFRVNLLHENDFAERSKVFCIAGYRSENNFVRILKLMNNAAKSFDILAIGLSVPYNYFDSSTKLLL